MEFGGARNKDLIEHLHCATSCSTINIIILSINSNSCHYGSLGISFKMPTFSVYVVYCDMENNLVRRKQSDAALPLVTLDCINLRQTNLALLHLN